MVAGTHAGRLLPLLRHGGLLLPGKREDGSVAGRPLGVHPLLLYQEGVKVKEEWMVCLCVCVCVCVCLEAAAGGLPLLVDMKPHLLCLFAAW